MLFTLLDEKEPWLKLGVLLLLRDDSLLLLDVFKLLLCADERLCEAEDDVGVVEVDGLDDCDLFACGCCANGGIKPSGDGCQLGNYKKKLISIN